MQAILVISIFDLSERMRLVGVQNAVAEVYSMQAILRLHLDNRRMQILGDKVVALLDSTQEAMSRASLLLSTLQREGIPACAVVAFGSVFTTADREYWGIEINNALYLVSSEVSRYEVMLAPSARDDLGLESDHC